MSTLGDVLELKGSINPNYKNAFPLLPLVDPKTSNFNHGAHNIAKLHLTSALWQACRFPVGSSFTWKGDKLFIMQLF